MKHELNCPEKKLINLTKIKEKFYTTKQDKNSFIYKKTNFKLNSLNFT
jgi:hypothetical protein